MSEVIVVGASNTDIAGESFAPIVAGDSNIGAVSMAQGGVGHNIALNISRLGHSTKFITAIGDDGFGRVAEEEMKKELDISDAIHTGGRSGIYLYVADPKGDMYVAVNDMDAVKSITPEFLETKASILKEAKLVVLDANLTEEAIAKASSLAGGMVLADCVSTLKAPRLLPSLRNIDVLKPNQMELEYLSGVEVRDPATLRKAADVLLEKGVSALLVTFGIRGSVYITKDLWYYAPALMTEPVSSTGAGDSFLGGFVSGLLETGDIRTALRYASAAASITVEALETVSPRISRELIREKIKEINTYDEVSGLFR